MLTFANRGGVHVRDRKERKAAAFDLAAYVRAYRREDRCLPRNVMRQPAADHDGGAGEERSGKKLDKT